MSDGLALLIIGTAIGVGACAALDATRRPWLLAMAAAVALAIAVGLYAVLRARRGEPIEVFLRAAIVPFGGGALLNALAVKLGFAVRKERGDGGGAKPP